MISVESTNIASDELKLRTVRMNSRSLKRKTCTVSKFSSDICVKCVCVLVLATFWLVLTT